MRPFSIMTAPPRRPRRAPNSGASIRKPRMPNKETSSSIDHRLGKHHGRDGRQPQLRSRWNGKKDSGGARQGETTNTRTCSHPNRLNLLTSTPQLSPRSNFLRKSRVKFGVEARFLMRMEQIFAAEDSCHYS